MIHIADTKIARRYGDYFIRQINKIEEVSGFELFLVVSIFSINKLWCFNVFDND